MRQIKCNIIEVQRVVFCLLVFCIINIKIYSLKHCHVLYILYVVAVESEREKLFAYCLCFVYINCHRPFHCFTQRKVNPCCVAFFQFCSAFLLCAIFKSPLKFYVVRTYNVRWIKLTDRRKKWNTIISIELASCCLILVGIYTIGTSVMWK